MIRVLFGAKGQLVVGVLVFALVLVQWAWWTWMDKPSVVVLFHISMEALALAAYAIVATALGFRATERVEQVVIENADIDVEVER